MAAYTTIDDPSAYFKVQLYTGNGSANHAITFDDTDTDMQPDLVWIKNRAATDSHCLFDAVRGATKVLSIDDGIVEATDADTLDSFTSDGFQVDADVKVNTNTETYVAWNWKESATPGFDIVSYTGSGSARTISHSLSAVPNCMIFKGRDAVTNWIMYHHSLGNTYGMVVNEAEDLDDKAHYFNDTTPTSSVFSLGDGNQTNTDGDDFIAYLFAEKQGFSKFGSYLGNGNANGAFVYTGFKPAFVMVKASSSNGQNWVIHDNKRTTSGGNVINRQLYANNSNADDTNDGVDLLSNGFKFRWTGGDVNYSGRTNIYMAFAESPFVNSNGVPNNAE